MSTLKEMSQNIVLRQSHKSDLVRNLRVSSEEIRASGVFPEAPDRPLLKKQLFISEANANPEWNEVNGREQKTGTTMEAENKSHFLVLTDEDEYSEFLHNDNVQNGNWISNDCDYDGDITDDEDIALCGTGAINNEQLLFDADADDEDEDTDDDGNTNNEDINHHDCDESFLYEKSESSVFSGEYHEDCENTKHFQDIDIGKNSLNYITSDVDSDIKDDSISFMARESSQISPLGGDLNDSEMESIYVNVANCLPQDCSSQEIHQYFDQSPEFRFRLQYQVRVILLHPLFVLGGRKQSVFLNIFKKIFRKNFLSTGFSSVRDLCKAMPHVVNGKLLDEKGELYLVESSKNLRVVAGIRSGLRRIVFNIVQSHPLGLSPDKFEKEIYNEIGKTLTDVLTEHAYAKPKVEWMVRDMLDIVFFKYTESSQIIVLSNDAEDPAITDGLLIGISNSNRRFSADASGMEVSSARAAGGAPRATDESYDYQVTEKKIEGNLLHPEIYDTGKPPQSLSNELHADKSISDDVNCPSLTHQARVFCGHKYMETTAYYEKSISCSEEYILQVKLCLRLLLACWNGENGIEARNLQEMYERTFATNLNLKELGFTSIGELIKCWSDIALLNDNKPGIVFLQPSVENKRIVKTVATGFRATVLSVLLDSFPDGMDISTFIESLSQCCGNFLEVLKENGYVYAGISEISRFFLVERCHSQQHISQTLRLFFHDISDFVRFGCQEDGSLVVKLRSEKFPILDFPDCSTDGFLPEKIFEEKMSSIEENASLPARQSLNGPLNKSENYLHTYAVEMNGYKHDLVPSVLCSYTKSSLQVLKHQFRLILGSPMYLNHGIHCRQLSSIYEERTGQAFFMAEHNDVKSLLSLMPEVVSINSTSDQIFLNRTSHNSRILSVVKSGIRQVLYWCLLKNCAGIWDQLLEGWYTDFAGNSLVMTLSKHGYMISKKSYLASVSTFLEDMGDFVIHHSTEDGLYVLSNNSEDPTLTDARLLSMSPLDIQYDPLREHFQSFYDEVDGFGESSSDILDLLTRKSVNKNEIDDSGSRRGFFKHAIEHSSSEACLNMQGRQKLTMSNADEKDNYQCDENEPPSVTRTAR